jgi:hypothetical protein
MAENNSLDTAIREPSLVPDEVEMLLFALERSRAQFAWKPPNLRRMLVDLHDEYARHVGHADLFREAVDGLVDEDPPQG